MELSHDKPSKSSGVAYKPRDLWTIRSVLAGRDVNGDLALVSAGLHPLVSHLSSLPFGPKKRERSLALDGWLCGRDDRDAFRTALAACDPDDPPPEGDAEPMPADLGDIRRVGGGVKWIWEPWIPEATITGIAALEGVGKTRLALDLARRIWFGLPWPDEQPATFAKGTPTLWVCSDGQQDEILTTATEFGMPDNAIRFNTTPDEPYDGTGADKAEDRERLERFILRVRPALVIIDSLTNATSYDLCKAYDVQALMSPLRDIAKRTRTTIVPLLHVAMDGQALGKRVKGLTRTLIHLECPDPSDRGRLRLWTEKTFGRVATELGIRMDEAGSAYDDKPPPPGAGRKPGRPAKASAKAEVFIRKALEEGDRILTELRDAWYVEGGTYDTFKRVIERMEETGEVTIDGGPGTRQQALIHLNETQNAK